MTCWRTLPHSVGSISPSPVTTFGLLSGPSLGSGPYAMFAPRSGCRPLKRAVLNKSSGDPYNVDISQTSVSGLSSGGFMAVQFEVAFSSTLRGAGVIAGGPYYCAQGNLLTATSTCSCVPFGCFGQSSTNVAQLIAITDRNAGRGVIDNTGNLDRHRIWLFSGTSDTAVPQRVMDDLFTYYRHYIKAASIFYKKLGLVGLRRLELRGEIRPPDGRRQRHDRSYCERSTRFGCAGQPAGNRRLRYVDFALMDRGRERNRVQHLSRRRQCDRQSGCRDVLHRRRPLAGHDVQVRGESG